MLHTEQIINQIQTTSNLVNIVSKYVSIQGSHKVLKGTCPFHNDNQNSLMVSPEKNIFKCFGCGREGGPIEFIMAIEGASRQDAVNVLAKDFNFTAVQKD